MSNPKELLQCGDMLGNGDIYACGKCSFCEYDGSAAVARIKFDWALKYLADKIKNETDK